MTDPSLPVELSGPLTINVPAGQTQAPLTIRKATDDGGITINIKRPGLPDTPFVGESSGTTSGGTTTVTGSGAFPGKILSGSGDTYTVRIYPDGLSGATSDVSVKQLSIAVGGVIPADTWTLVTLAGGNYYMQVPVWLS